ncbi:YppE family protein [Salisediminibacterium halotolerans]|uniref:DUF1798 family protein n=1 Tax=Salisediminibacterium halotolerans TaxID=517425 RepID=A0A1H9NYP1_9BACI|nr:MULTISPECIES: YppE family protein [Salisediminibacterium]RLJ77901.1 uncharacterized protein DUF1798 [Actinophytocola xinjiangensis]RPE88761.1 uncharacterized protein DUF1798 [Salisediminibacterium halotolerans]TWG36878.1 uncharacterized protein DUF1798 [Salisediminibacterium halotolerans]SER41048.1 protein of unknown function [Salisediminibacterium haloalkalitolerans]GEL09188.1 hypothetical protein SHA02_26040 [Salisediminibacterium halotolerans]
MTDKQRTLQEQTENLKRLNKKTYEYFNQYSQSNSEADFHKEVKPFADEVKEALEAWVPIVTEWIDHEKPQYLHREQIDQLTENFEVAAVACFQSDTKKKRFIERYKSIEYTLSIVSPEGGDD